MEADIDKDTRLQLLVWGYIKRMEKEYQIENIPKEIKQLIYLYQNYCDTWNKEFSSSNVNIIHERNIVTFNTDSQVTAFGNHVVSEGIFIWKLKLIKLNRGHAKAPPYVGIIKESETNLWQHSNKVSWETCGYQYCAGNNTLWGPNKAHDEYVEHAVGDCEWIKPDDILEITLNLKEQTVDFKINGEADCNWFSNIEQTEYRLALGVYKGKDSQFQLL